MKIATFAKPENITYNLQRPDSKKIIICQMPEIKEENSKEKWNQILYENANKLHIHQDNLRWTLTGGFVAFFYGGILLLHNEKIYSDRELVKNLQLAFLVMGTLYWFVIAVEGWYYNFYLKYLMECEERIISSNDIEPFVNFDRSKVKMFHPSFSLLLIFIAVANSVHLYSLSLSITTCAIYISVAIIISIFGFVFRSIDVTISKNKLNSKKQNRKKTKKIVQNKFKG